MIEPTKKITDFKIFPQKIPFRVRFFGIVFRPFVRYCRRRKKADIFKHTLPNLMEKVQRCCCRAELEKILGKPKYVLRGDNFISYSPNGEILVPKFVETYIKKGCQIDIWFSHDRMIHFTGSLFISPWDKISGITCDNNLDKKEKNHKRNFLSFSKDKEKKMLDEDINLDNFKEFLKIYFPERNNPVDEKLIPQIFNILKSTNKYSKLSDLKKILQRTSKAHKALCNEIKFYSVASEFVTILAFTHPEIREGTNLISQIHVDLIKKFEHLIEPAY